MGSKTEFIVNKNDVKRAKDNSKEINPVGRSDWGTKSKAEILVDKNQIEKAKKNVDNKQSNYSTDNYENEKKYEENQELVTEEFKASTEANNHTSSKTSEKKDHYNDKKSYKKSDDEKKEAS